MSVPGTLTAAINKICDKLRSQDTYKGESVSVKNETFMFKLDKNASKFTVWYRISPDHGWEMAQSGSQSGGSFQSKTGAVTKEVWISLSHPRVCRC